MLCVAMVCFCIDAIRLNGLFLYRWCFLFMLYVSMVCFYVDAIRLNGLFLY